MSDREQPSRIETFLYDADGAAPKKRASRSAVKAWSWTLRAVSLRGTRTTSSAGRSVLPTVLPN
jgi:hypothetical protein